jgi:ABC-2 type transport system ATP-binding protein
MGFLGRNGAGKTTTLRILAGIFQEDSGEILLDGARFKRTDVKVGYLPEEKGMYPKVDVIDQLIYIGRLKGMGAVEAAQAAKRWLAVFELGDYEKKALGILSKGNQQKVQIIQSVINDPDILLLDEPFSGLDPVNARFLKNVLKEYEHKGKIVVFSSHEMGYVEEFCNDITFIRGGLIILSGNLKQLKRERGKDKVYLTVREMDAEKLSKELSGEVMGGRAVIALGQNETRDSFLKKTMDRGWHIEAYGDYEPSLDLIFIEQEG